MQQVIVYRVHLIRDVVLFYALRRIHQVTCFLSLSAYTICYTVFFLLTCLCIFNQRTLDVDFLLTALHNSL